VILCVGVIAFGSFLGSSATNLISGAGKSKETNIGEQVKSEITVMHTEVSNYSIIEIALLFVIAAMILSGAIYFVYKKVSGTKSDNTQQDIELANVNAAQVNLNESSQIDLGEFAAE